MPLGIVKHYTVQNIEDLILFNEVWDDKKVTLALILFKKCCGLLNLTDVCLLLTKQSIQVGLQIQCMLYNF
jgi:hypothetical protein